MLKEKALTFATKAHIGQMRKTTSTAMINHPIAVAETLEKAGFSQKLVAAGFLHDVVEDTDFTMEDIVKEFGKEVAFFVSGNTEDKEKSWEERKTHTIESIKTAPLEIKALIVADKLDNLKALVKDYETFGEEIWSHFKRGREKQAWYFKGVCENMKHNVEEKDIPEFFITYEKLVHSFFK